MAGRSIRVFVRTKKRYEPAYFESQLWHIDVTDFAGCSVGDIKRKCHKETYAKVDDLFYLNQSLADDRSVAHYNFPDGAILETTSNPLWVAMIHVKMVEIERERDTHPDDHHVQRWTHRSFAKKTTLLSVLFNAKKHENVQPPNFPVYEDFILYLERLGRKGANINPNYSGQDFQRWFAEHLQLDVDKPDPIRAFQTRHAARLGLCPVEGQSSGNKQKKTSDNSNHSKEKGKQPMKRATATATRTRPAQQERLCEDCEETQAEIYCDSCVGPGGSSGVVLCMDCTHRIHRGALRGNHDCTDISQAPRAPATPQQYLPHPYKSPFAVLLAMTRALKENEHKLSLNEEEIKQRAQPITDTDLHDKPVGKMMGGFDCIENTLIPKNLVQKEAADRHTFALTQSGRELGQKLDIFDNMMQKFLADSGVPQPPSNFRSHVGGRQVILVMDGRERDAARMATLARSAGITILIRNLQVADYVWVLSPDTDGASVPYDGSLMDQEIMMPVLVERKSWHDLHDSIRLGRWTTQLHRMKACGLPLNFVLVEGCLSDLRQVSQDRRDFLQTEVERLSVEEGFHIGRTFSWAKSAAWLFWMTHILAEAYSEGLFKGETLLYSELSSRMVRGERERRLGGIVRPLTPCGPSCIWEPDHLVTAIFRHSLGERKMTDTYRREFPSGQVRQLLVLQNLEVYNKNRQNLLLTALKQAASLENYTPDSVRGVIEERLMADLKSLVHYDVLGYWILTLQVRQQVYVMRSETEEDTQRLQNWFSQGQQLPKEAELKKKNTVGESTGLAAGDRKDGEREEEKLGCVADDFASDSQAEERMLQEALSLSLISTLDAEDQDDKLDTAVSPVLAPVRNSPSHQQSEQLTSQQLTSQPASSSNAPLPKLFPFSAGGTQHDPERSQSPLGFTQDDPILIDSQGLDEEPPQMEVDGRATQDSCGSGNSVIESHKPEKVVLTHKTEQRQVVMESILQEDEVLARRLQAEEDLKDPSNLKRVKRRKSLGHEDSVECGPSEGSGWKQEDVNRNSLDSCGAGTEWRDTDRADCVRTVADTVIKPSSYLTHSQHKHQAPCLSGQLFSSPRKRPAQTTAESSSCSVPESKKLKSQLESDEEFARRLQRELDGEEADQTAALSLSLEDSHTASECVGSSPGLASSPKNLWPKVKEEDEDVALILQEEEMLGLSVQGTGSAQPDDLLSKHCDSDSFMSDEALARRLQEEEESQRKSLLLSKNTSSPVSKKTAETVTNCGAFKDVEESAKVETFYIESDEELARRLQEEEEREARKAQVSAQPPVQTRRSQVKRDTTLDVSREDDDCLAHRLRKEQEMGMLGQAGGEKAGETHGGISLVESEPGASVMENTGQGVDTKGSSMPSPDAPVKDSVEDVKGSVGSTSASQQCSSIFGGDGATPTAESGSATVVSNVKCGSCGQKGHNRRFERCPNYYTEKEKNRRDAMEEAHRQRAEERAREAEERQREEQRALERLAVTRNVLQHNKEQMMQQIAAATQECASQFQSQLDDIDRLINSKQRKLKATPAKQKKQ